MYPNFTTRNASSGNPSRRSVALTILGFIAGGISCILGAILLIAMIGMGFEGEEWGLLFMLGLVGAHLIAGGVALIIIPRRLGQQPPAQRIMAGPEVLVGQRPASDSVYEYDPVLPTPHFEVEPAPKPVPSKPAERTELSPIEASTDGSKTDHREEVANLVIRSQDVLAILKDLVKYEDPSKPSARHHLAEMLSATGLPSWDNAPHCEAGRLTRTHHFWIRQNTDSLSNEEYDRLISIEAALSVNQDLGEELVRSTIAEARPAVGELMRALTTQAIEPYDLGSSLGVAYPGVPYDQTPGEWLVRARFASAAECAVTPFRVVHDHRVCVETGTMVISLELVRPRCMAIFSSDQREQVALARAYGLRVSALLARQALDITERLHTVVVNCHERDSVETLLSIKYTRDLLSRLASILEAGAIDGNGFPTDPNIRTSFGQDGWFAPVTPFVAMDDELVSPRERFTYPELDHRPTSEALRTITGARTFDELGINENAGRLAARDYLRLHPWSTTQEAVSTLVDMRNEAEDITVAEACNRVIEALLAGTLDAADTEGVFDLFIGGTTLNKAAIRADTLMDDEEGTPDPEAAIKILTEALAPIESLGAYFDDSDTVYRYFGSVAERIRFELDVDDHRRTVKLVPDAYYNALSTLSVAHDALGNTDEALRYADEMIRIAPVSIHAVMRKVRVLEGASRVFEAADLIKNVLRYASTPRDAAICHYRLAFMEWKLGREDLTVACYQRSLNWDGEMSAQAREELDDLLAGNSSLHRFSSDEVDALLAREGIPLGCDDSDIRRTVAAAVLTCDEGSFWVARPLVGILFGLYSDDVMMGVYKSLSAPE